MLLELHIDMPDMPNAACRTSNPETFFPDSSRRPDRAARAKAICVGCPERVACLEYALEQPQLGIWGGLTEVERRHLAHKRGAAETCRTKESA